MRPETFRVMLGKDTLNYVQTATAERDDDSLAMRIEKRRKEAIHKAQGWSATQYQGQPIRVVPCNAQGKPL